MRKFTFFTIILLTVLQFFTFNLSAQNTNQQDRSRCATMDWLEEQLKNPVFRAQYQENQLKVKELMDKKIAELRAKPKTQRTEAITLIPVVFHVVLTSGQHAAYPDALILRQLDSLNKDYGGFNSDSANVPGAFQAVRGHSNYQFCLAQRTPGGLPTTGINRVTSTTQSNTSQTNDPIKSTAAGGASAWDPTKYVNIWLGTFTNPNLLGYASFPIGSPENPGGSITQQGVVCHYQTVPGGTFSPYNKGRTLTHELGHFFWLRHTWGDGNCASDFSTTPGLDDTPQQSNATFNCPGQAPNVVFVNANCAASPNPPGRMYQNYMDYTDDACMTMFSNGQNARSELAVSTWRASLLTSDGCLAPSGFSFDNPAPAVSACPAGASMSITLGTIGNGGFSNPITLSATAGVPAGTNVTFGTNPVIPGNSSVVTLNNTNILNSGSYVITITGVASGATNQTRDLTFTISPGAGPAITAQPLNQIICSGGNTSFSITSASATGFQWQVNTGAGFNNIANGGVYSGATTNTLSINGATAGMNNYQYRCIASVQCGSTASGVGILTVNAAPAISSQPASSTVCGGTNITNFSVTASGTGINYQWQVNFSGCSGGAWVALTNGGVYSGVSTGTLTITNATTTLNGYGYQCVVTGTCTPAATSNCVLLTVNTPVSISPQPANSNICNGSQTSFTVGATGTGLTYQWQESINGGTLWNNVSNGGVYSGATTVTLTLTGVTTGMNNYQYRCIVSGTAPCTPVNSNAATLSVNTVPAITLHPAATTILCAGNNTTFSIVANGTAITYQWQESTNGGALWNNITNGGVYSGATTATMTLTGVTASMNNNLYRCIVSGACTPAATSNSAAITVNTPITVTTHPTLVNICATGNASFTVAATGTTPTYQWQESTNNGTSWNNISNGGVYGGATTTTLTLTAVTAGMNGNLYRSVVTGASPCGSVNSNGAVLNVTPQPVITANPFTSLLPGRITTLSVNVTPAAGLTFAWFLNNNLLPAATGNSVTATVNELGNYRVIVTSATGSCQSELFNIKDSASNRLFIFPSPNDGRCTVAYYNAGGASISRTIVIYDSKGARVFNRKFNVSGPYTLIPIDIRPAQAGVFYVVVGDASGKKIIEGKVLVQ